MSHTASFAPHLPYLRRYARALTGSQRSGDAYVRASLEALVAGERELATDATPRVALYHLFHVIWASSTTDAHDRGMSEPATPDGRLQSLMRSNREALLLTAVEGFSPRETARILDKSEDEIEREIVEAQQAILQQVYFLPEIPECVRRPAAAEHRLYRDGKAGEKPDPQPREPICCVQSSLL